MVTKVTKVIRGFARKLLLCIFFFSPNKKNNTKGYYANTYKTEFLGRFDKAETLLMIPRLGATKIAGPPHT